MNGDVAALIPAYNEAGPIVAVITAIQRLVGTVVVVDDGSSDSTAEVARLAGAEVIRHASRRGKGAAIRTGLARLQGRGHRYILMLDADGQHDPEDAPNLIAALARARVASISRSRGAALVTSASRSTRASAAICSTARSKAA